MGVLAISMEQNNKRTNFAEDLAAIWDQMEHSQGTFGPEGHAAGLSLPSGKFVSPKNMVLLV